MNVTPDLLPSIEPEVDLRIVVSGETLVPGVFTQPAAVSDLVERPICSQQLNRLPLQTREQVELSAQVFHEEEKLYTLLMIDPGARPSQIRRQTGLDWLTFNLQMFPTSSIAHTRLLRTCSCNLFHAVNHSSFTDMKCVPSRSPNIPLSSTVSTISAPALLPYVPPHPQQGTPYHRYTFLLLAQEGPLELSPEAIERQGFDVREFVQDHKLAAKGVTFFRQKWDKAVSEIYREVLSKFVSGAKALTTSVTRSSESPRKLTFSPAFPLRHPVLAANRGRRAKVWAATQGGHVCWSTTKVRSRVDGGRIGTLSWNVHVRRITSLEVTCSRMKSAKLRDSKASMLD